MNSTIIRSDIQSTVHIQRDSRPWYARNPITHLTVTAWRNAEAFHRQMIIYGVLSSVALTVSLFEPLVIGRLMNLVQEAATGGDTSVLLHQITLLLALYCGLIVGTWIFHGPSRVMERNVAFQIRKSFQMKLFTSVCALPLQWHRDHHSGSTIDKITKSTTSLYDFCDSSFETIHMFIRFVGCMVILTIFMPIAGIALSVATVLIVTAVLLFDRVLIATYEEINARFHTVAESVHDYVTNIKTVISLRLEDNVAHEVEDRLDNVGPILKKSILYNEVKWCVASVLIALVTVSILFAYSYHVIATHGVLLAGTFFTLFDYLRRIGEAFFVFCFKYGDLVKQSAGVRATEPLLADYEKLVRAGQSAALPAVWKKIEVTGLSFAYGDRQGINGDESGQNLHSVALTLERGKSYAFIGESGSGKSTTLSLLRALNHPRTVQVRCDGTDLPDGLLHVAHHTTLIPQDPEIFAVTIRENISMGLQVSDAEVLTAVRQAQCAEVVKRLPRGLDTSIAERGVNLSGGEKQRLALARGFLFARGSEIVMLDEPTSNVDIVNERIIYENVLRTFKGRCVISTIHKLYLLPLFDEIYVFSNGRVVEHGALATLLSLNGELARLWRSYHLEIERESV